MAANMFGTPIDTSFVEGLPDYAGKTITCFDRAHVALQYKNAEGKDINAQTYVDNLKERYGWGVSTKCMIYNATGDKITFVGSCDYHGYIGESPYPSDIENGQWGAFLHVHTTAAAAGSSAAIAYRGLNNNGDSCEWCLGWATQWNTAWSNKAFAEARQAGHYAGGTWDVVYDLMDKHDLYCNDTWNGCVTKATEGEGTTVYFVGIMTLENA